VLVKAKIYILVSAIVKHFMKMRVLILTVFSLLLIAYAPPYTHYVAAQPVYYVPINLYSSSGIRGIYQLNVTFDPSLYKSYLSPDLGNIRFMFSNGTMLHAWLESYSGTSPLNSQSALIWVNLPDGVPRGNTVIFMVFEHNQTFDGYWMGEAPQLSPKYGEYDNGMYVFDYYTNFMNNRSLDVWDLNGTLPGFAVFNDGMWLNAGLVNGYQFTMKKSYTGNYTVDAFEWAANASVNSQYHMGSDNVYPGISFNQLRTSNYTLIPPGNSGGFQEAETYLPTFTEYLSTTNATSNGANGYPPQIQTAIPITSPAVFTIGFSGSTVFSQINYSYTISYKNSNTAGPNFPGLTTLALAQTSDDWIHVFWFRVRTTPSSAVSVSISKTPTPMLVGLTITSESGGSVSYFWSGGNGTVQPSQTATIYVAYGSQVKLYAHPNSGWSFASWNGSGSGSYSGTNNPITVQVNNSMTETANYNVALTISANGLESSAQGTIVTVNGNPYTYSQLPVTLYIAPGSTVTYSWNSPVPSGTGVRFVWASTSGQATGQTGSFSMPSSPVALTGSYQKQYYLNMSFYPEGSASVSPSSGWYDSGSLVNISSRANPGYEFVFWKGEGNGSYTGPYVKSRVIMDSPITEISVSYVEVSISSTPGGYIYFYYDGTSFKVQNFTTYLPYMANVSLSPAAYPGYYFSGWNLSPVNGTFVLLYPSSFKAVFLKYNVINFSVISSSSSLLNAYGELVDQQGNIIINSGEQTQVKPGLYFLVISQDQFNQTPYKFYFGSQNLSEFSQITMVNITGNGKSYRLLAVDPVKTSISVHVVSLYDREVYLTVSLINQITNAPIPYQVVQITLWSEYGNYSVSVNTGPQGRVSIDIPYVHGGTYSWRAYYSGNSSIGTDPCASSSSLKTSLFSSKIKINENGLPKGTSWSGSIGGYSFVSSQGSVILNVYSGRYSLGINPVFTQQIEYVPSAYPSFINAFGSVSISVNYSVYFYVYITSGNIHGGTVSMYGTYWFPNGSKITLSADPNAGYRFSGWVTTGSSIKISNYSAEETTVTINGPGVIIAEFEPES